MDQAASPSQRIINGEFLALNAILFISYCNVALFFQFHDYLGTLPIEKEWFGFLIAVFSLVVLVVRPGISPFLNTGNASFWIGASCLLMIPTLLCYAAAQHLWTMTLVRIVHGIAYVVMVTALTSRLVACIPSDRSAQFFSLISVMTLLPYAVIPPVLDPLTRFAGGFQYVLMLSAIPIIAVFPLLRLFIKPAKGSEDARREQVTRREICRNLQDPPIFLMLILSLLLWATFTPVFFFLRGYGKELNIPNPGWFFTLSTLTEIGVRLLAGSFFDRLNKPKALAFSFLWLTAGYLVLANVGGGYALYSLGLLLGIGWGVALPVLSGLIFDFSPLKFRALNTNLSMVMFQGGYFLGPLAGGFLIIHGGYGRMLYVCGGVLTICAIVSALLSIIGKGRAAAATEPVRPR
ncbi:MAG: MFS transporter [Deltaproteobacteria bacterium]|nr:MFS transporter [Deltaproteobacteria bacterium]